MITANTYYSYGWDNKGINHRRLAFSWASSTFQCRQRSVQNRSSMPPDSPAGDHIGIKDRKGLWVFLRGSLHRSDRPQTSLFDGSLKGLWQKFVFDLGLNIISSAWNERESASIYRLKNCLVKNDNVFILDSTLQAKPPKPAFFFLFLLTSVGIILFSLTTTTEG